MPEFRTTPERIARIMKRIPDEALADGPMAQPRDLPSIDTLLRLPSLQAAIERHGQTLVTQEARALIQELREQVSRAELPAATLAPALLCERIERRCHERIAARMRTVINLTGTVIHTNLGRAPLPRAAIDHVAAMMSGPNNLEFDLESGGRGDRDSIVESLLTQLTGAEAATVVNNNAAAVLLTLAALAHRKEVVISRGELVEIGGAFRIPEVMRSAGARMIEVGTTNRTHPRDYEQAIGPRTALLVKAHTSNYAVQGFTASVDEAGLSRIAHAHGLPLVCDLGSGSLVDLAQFGLPAEPLPQRMLAAGCDVVTFSGDKLLGGPQAGLIVGRRDLIEKIRRHPMKRALRLSKLPLAALEATLILYLQPEHLTRDLPTLRLLTRPLADIEACAARLMPVLADALAPGFHVATASLQSQIGSGSLPIELLPSAGLSISVVPPSSPAERAAGRTATRSAGTARRRASGRALERLAAALRGLPTPVIGRISEDRLLLDLRCLLEPDALTSQLDTLRERLQLDLDGSHPS